MTLFIASVIPVVRTSKNLRSPVYVCKKDIKIKLKSLKVLKSSADCLAWEARSPGKYAPQQTPFQGGTRRLSFSMVLFLTLSSVTLYMDISMRRIVLGQDDIEVDCTKHKDSKEFARYEKLLETEGIKDGYLIYALNDDYFMEVTALLMNLIFSAATYKWRSLASIRRHSVGC